MNKQPTDTISILELHRKISTMTKRVGQEKKHLLVTNHGLEFSAIIPIADYHEYLKLREEKKTVTGS